MIYPPPHPGTPIRRIGTSDFQRTKWLLIGPFFDKNDNYKRGVLLTDTSVIMMMINTKWIFIDEVPSSLALPQAIVITLNWICTESFPDTADSNKVDFFRAVSGWPNF